MDCRKSIYWISLIYLHTSCLLCLNPLTTQSRSRCSSASQSLNEPAWPTGEWSPNPFLWHLEIFIIWFYLHGYVENHAHVRWQPGSSGREEKQKSILFPATLSQYKSHVNCCFTASPINLETSDGKLVIYFYKFDLHLQ